MSTIITPLGSTPLFGKLTFILSLILTSSHLQTHFLMLLPQQHTHTHTHTHTLTDRWWQIRGGVKWDVKEGTVNCFTTYSVRQLVVSDSLWPHGPCRPPGSLCPWNSPSKNTAMEAPEHRRGPGSECGKGSGGSPERPSIGDLPNPGIQPGSPVLQADSLPSEPPGKPLRLINYPEKISIHYKVISLHKYLLSIMCQTKGYKR